MSNRKQSEEKPNVLIVDDLEINLELFKGILKSIGANLILARSGAEALKILPNQEIALALIDVQMPEMNGFDLANRINSKESDEFIPIIFITALAENNFEIASFYSQGVVDFILKPFKANILFNKVKVFLELYHQKKQILNQKIEMEKMVWELKIAN
jgi:response regulator RpfG family c-di-GMP phosphodiesterase